MSFDWASYVLGAGSAALVAWLLFRAWVGDFGQYQHRRDDERAAWEREQEYKLAERLAGMLRNMVSTRAAPEPDPLHPRTAAQQADDAFYTSVEELEAAQARVDRFRRLLKPIKGEKK